MMGKAGRFHALRGFGVAVLVALLGWGGYEIHGRLQAHALRRSLLDANTNMTYAVKYLAGAYRLANGNHGRAVH